VKGGLYDRATQDVLKENGVVGDYELTSDSALGKTANKLAEYGSGAPVESAVKTVAGLSEMRSILLSNGVDVSGNPKEIATTWREWSLDPANKEAYLMGRDRLESAMRYIGDVSAFSKSNVRVLNDYGFTQLQPYPYNRVNNVLRNSSKFVDGLIKLYNKDAKLSDPTIKESRKAVTRTAGDIAIYMGIAAAVSKLAQETMEVTEEVADKMGSSLSGKMFGGNPVFYVKQLIE
jgi:hypothetical protein